MRKRQFFTSDSHFGHGNIIKYCHRPFLGAEDRAELERLGGAWHNNTWKGNKASRWNMTREAIRLMDDELIHQINATVGVDDVLWHLGDFCMHSRSDSDEGYFERVRKYRKRINCKTVRLVWGNHDYHQLPDVDDSDRRTRAIPDDYRIENLFSSVHDLVELNTMAGKLVLCHYSMAVWNKSHRGNMHLYGHSHSQAEPWLDRTMVGRRGMDVGVDNAAKILGAYRPFSLNEIVELIGSKPGYAFDHHVSELSNLPEEHDLIN